MHFVAPFLAAVGAEGEFVTVDAQRDGVEDRSVMDLSAQPVAQVITRGLKLGLGGGAHGARGADQGIPGLDGSQLDVANRVHNVVGRSRVGYAA